MAAPGSLGEFIAALESQGELRRISEEVDPRLGITALTYPVMKAQGPALQIGRAHV